MRDHLLGCQAFLPPEPEPEDRTIYLRKRYALGVPERVYRKMEDAMVKSMEDKQQITAFEEFDHTPAEMQADFPSEYDLITMLNDAAKRWPPKMWLDLSGPAEDYAAIAQFYDGEMQRLCGLSPAPKGVEFGKLIVEFE